MDKVNAEYILSNSSFMDWVIQELNKHYLIDDKNREFSGDNLIYKDKFKTLFELVQEYAINNHIESTISIQYEFYYVFYKGSVFFVFKTDDTYGCFNNTLDKRNLLYCINFEEVVRSKIEDIINNEGVIDDLKEAIEGLHNQGVSIELIGNVINDNIKRFIEEIKKEDKGKTYLKKLED